MIIIDWYINRRVTNRLCERAVKIHRALDKNDTAGAAFRHSLIGELIGTRAAICLLNGWDPDRDADKEGPADDLIIAYWEKTYPQDWENPS